MNIHSIKTRFTAIFLFILILFIIQFPIVYVLVGQMSKKYAQVDAAGGLRKRAVEIVEIINRHIMNGDEALGTVVDTKRVEYGALLNRLKEGSDELPAITDADVLAKLDVVKGKWADMGEVMDITLEGGRDLRLQKDDVAASTLEMVGMLNETVKAFESLGSTYIKSVNMAALQRMKTVNMSYMLERYFNTNANLEAISGELNGSMESFAEALGVLRDGSPALGLKKVTSANLLSKLSAIDEAWMVRNELIMMSMLSKDLYYEGILELVGTHTPGIVVAADHLTKQIAANAKSAAMKALFVMGATILFSGLLVAVFMWSTSKHIIRPLIRLKDIMESLADGDLTKRASIKTRIFGREMRDEIASLAESVDLMAARTSDVISRIANASTSLAASSERLAGSSTSIAEASKQQSSQTSHVATAMEEMSATVIEVAKNSQQVAESAGEAMDIASKGGEVVTDAITAMQGVASSTSDMTERIQNLGESSEKIGSVASVINDIAEQTNLLALNAAIEAARAGEQGRGFAVVADEVKKLAEKTSSATKEIADMIKATQGETARVVTAIADGSEKVDNGVKLVNEAGEALSRIVTSVGSVTDMITHIAVSTEEQSATADEISRNMESISEVAASNVTAADEVAEATGEMTSLAAEFKDLVSRFKVDTKDQAPDLELVQGTGEEEPAEDGSGEKEVGSLKETG
jgi:methyl-accepting chemotaxis protein